MERLFGIPIGTLTVVLAVALAVAIGAVAALAVRNRVFLKLGVRNIGRRRGRSGLIVVGLMLGTAIIASALSTGDTVGSSIRSSVLESLGQTDEIVAAKSAGTAAENAFQEQAVGQVSGVRYLDESVVQDVERAVAGSGLVDGVAPAIVEQVAAQDATSRQTEPRITLFGSDPARLRGFGDITEVGGGAVSLADLGAGQTYLNREGADELDARPGDRILVYAAGKATPLTVETIVDYAGAGTDGAALLLPLAPAQKLLGREGEIREVLVSNVGGSVSGAAKTDAVVSLLEPTLAPLGLEATAAKQDGLDAADEQGNVFMSFFTMFGTFSIAAGILLIFLIFVMLAAERRTELGIARAVGTQRRNLVEMFLFEGVAYDIAAAAVGALLGVGIAYGMVLLIAQAVGSTGLDIEYDFRARSLVVAYALGVLVTLVVVTIAAWRVSVLNIVTAIRSLPEPLRRRTRRFRLVWAFAGLVAGGLLVVAGVAGEQLMPFGLGVSVAIVSLVPLVRALGLPERAAYTIAGVALVVWWLLPFDVFQAIIPNLGMDFSVWIVGGIMVVVGATWTLVYNADALLGGAMALLGRVRTLAPVLKMAAAYPLRSRFRTGTTLTMFTLVVYTLVVGATTTNAFRSAFDDVQEFGGGFDVRADAAGTNPVGDMKAALGQAPGLDPADFEVVASQAFLPVDARQVGSGTFEAYPLRGFDDAFLDTTTYGLAATARGYGSAAEVWRAVARTPGLAVVDPYVVPRRTDWNFGFAPDFRLSGFYLEDKTFDPVSVQVRDPQSGKSLTLTVVGVLKDTAPYSLAGISTSQRTLAAFGARAQPTVYYFKLAPGVDPERTAATLESDFLANGLEADSMEDLLADAVGSSRTFQQLLQGFMGLGLVVGVAALGVISARAVVERRQQIGVLRSIGFQRRMIQGSLLLESSFISLTAIVVGTALGLITAYNVISDSAEQPSWDNLAFAVPWLNLAIVFAAVYAASLAASYVPALKASRVYPAEALRYQ